MNLMVRERLMGEKTHALKRIVLNGSANYRLGSLCNTVGRRETFLTSSSLAPTVELEHIRNGETAISHWRVA